MLRRITFFSPTSIALALKQRELIKRTQRQFALDARGDIPESQARPTFAAPASPRGEWMDIDTSFVDVPDVAEEMPMPEDVAESIELVQKMQDRQRRATITTAQQQQQLGGVLSPSPSCRHAMLEEKGTGDGGGDDTKKLSRQQPPVPPLPLSASPSSAPSVVVADPSHNINTSSSHSSLLVRLPHLETQLDKQVDSEWLNASPRQRALTEYRARIRVATSLRKMCENFTLMDQEGFLTFRSAQELNSGPEYEVRAMKLTRRRAWFQLRHAFLKAAPVLFAATTKIGDDLSSSSLPAVARSSNEEEGEDGGGDVLAATALSALTEASSVLTWMHTAAENSGKWSQPISWDRRPASDFDKIDFATLARQLLQQFAALLEATTKTTATATVTATKLSSPLPPPLPLQEFIRLSALCSRVGVDGALISQTLGADTMQQVIAASLRDGSLTALAAVSLGLCCQESSLELDNGTAIAQNLMRAVVSKNNALLESFGGPELSFLMEFLLRVVQANEKKGVNIKKRASSSNGNSSGDKEVVEEEIKRGWDLVNTCLTAAQRRMRILLSRNMSNSSTNSSDLTNAEGEIIPVEGGGGADGKKEDDGGFLSPLKKFVEANKRNNVGGVIDLLDHHRAHFAAGMQEKKVSPSQVTRFFRLLTDISERQQSRLFEEEQAAKKGETSSSSSFASVAAADQQQASYLSTVAWVNDVVSRAVYQRYNPTDRFSISIHECVSLLEAFAAAVPRLFFQRHDHNNGASSTSSSLSSSPVSKAGLAIASSSNFQKLFGTIIPKALRDQAIYLELADAVKLLGYLADLKPLFDAMEEVENSVVSRRDWNSCLDSVELCLLRYSSSSSSEGKRDSSTTERKKKNSLSLAQCALLCRAFDRLKYYPRLVMRELPRIALATLEARRAIAFADAITVAATLCRSGLFFDSSFEPPQPPAKTKKKKGKKTTKGGKATADASATEQQSTPLAEGEEEKASDLVRLIRAVATNADNNWQGRLCDLTGLLTLLSWLPPAGETPFYCRPDKYRTPFRALVSSCHRVTSTFDPTDPQNEHELAAWLTKCSNAELLEIARGWSVYVPWMFKPSSTGSFRWDLQYVLLSELVQRTNGDGGFNFVELAEILTLSVSLLRFVANELPQRARVSTPYTLCMFRTRWGNIQEVGKEKNSPLSQRVADAIEACTQQLVRDPISSASSSSIDIHTMARVCITIVQVCHCQVSEVELKRREEKVRTAGSNQSLQYIHISSPDRNVPMFLQREQNRTTRPEDRKPIPDSDCLKKSQPDFYEQVSRSEFWFNQPAASKAAIRFLVYCVSSSTASSQQGEQKNFHQQQKNQKSSASSFGFEHEHLARAEKKSQLEQEAAMFGEALKQCLAPNDVEGWKIAEEAWQEFQ